MADAKLALAVAAPVATPCRAPLAALQAPIWQGIHASAERRKEELEAEAAAAALKRSKRSARPSVAATGRAMPSSKEMGSQLAAETGSQLVAALPAVAGYSWCRCWQQALTPGHKLSPINSKDYDRLWKGFEQQEVEDIFTASEAEPCAARSSSAGPKQDEVQPKQGEARPTADEKVGKGSWRANPKKSAKPAPPAGPQRPEDQPAQPAEKPQQVFHIFSHQGAAHARSDASLGAHTAHPTVPDLAREAWNFYPLGTATGPTGALWRTWRCRERESRTSTPARGLARAIRSWWSCSATFPKER